MASDPITLGILALSGYQAYTQKQAGEDADQKYKELAAEEYRQSAVEQKFAVQEMLEVDRQARSQRGKVLAAAGKAGVRASGSVLKLTDKIRVDIDRRKTLMGAKSVEMAKRHAVRADWYRSSGRSARVAGQRQAIGSLLTGTYLAASRRAEKGTWPFKEK